jgi:hypothetical protein
MLTVTATAAALAVSGVVLAKVVKGADPLPANAPSERTAAPTAVYERIVPEDPAVRAEISGLYAEERAFQEEAMRKLADLQARIASENGWEGRRALLAEAGSVKASLELRHVEIGLRIAELNGDTQRAEDFARALQQINDADQLRQATLADPRLEAERKRQLGQ